MLHTHVGEPDERHALADQAPLQITTQRGLGVDGGGIASGLEGMRGEDARRLADVPLHWMQPVAAVGDVSGAEVLGAREKVPHPHRDQRAHGNLERTRAARDADVVRPGVVDVDWVEAHSDRVLEVRRERAALIIGRYLLLEYGLASPEPPALAYVRVLAQAIHRREDVGTGPELGKPRAAAPPSAASRGSP